MTFFLLFWMQFNLVSICISLYDDAWWRSPSQLYFYMQMYDWSIHLYVDAHKCSEIMKLLSHAKLVKEFIVNLSSGFNNVGGREYIKVYVRGHCFVFSSKIINECLGRGRPITIVRFPYLNTIAWEITCNIHEYWPSKYILIDANLSVKNDIL